MPTQFYTPLNDAVSTLAVAHNIGDGVLVVTDASKFGSPSTSAPIRVSAHTSSTTFVIFAITSITGNTLHIGSVIEGTSDINLPAGLTVEDDLTAGHIQDAYTAIHNLEVNGTVGTGLAGGDLAGNYPNPTIKSGVSLTGQPQINAHFGSITSNTDAATITFNLALTDKHQVVLGGNRTLAVSNDQNGQGFMIILQQDGTGGRTVTWWSGILWSGGTLPALTTTPNKRDVFSFLKLSSGLYIGSYATGF